MLTGTAHRAIRLRVGMVLFATTLVLGTGGLVPIQASPATTVRTLTFVGTSFPVKDYSGAVTITRTLPGSAATFTLSLLKTTTGTTTDGQSQKAAETDIFVSTWKSGTFTTPTNPTKPTKMLASGKLDSGTQMGTFGSLTMTIGTPGKLVHKSSCSGKIDTYSRSVQLAGTFTANPDSPTATPYFGTVSEAGFAGRLIFVINRKSGSPCTPTPTICPTGVQLAYTDSTNPANVWAWAAGNITIAGTARYTFVGFDVDLSNPSVVVVRFVLVLTQDSTWFTAHSDLTAAHADTGILNFPGVSGVTDYTYDGTAATSKPSTCARKTFTTLTTNGTLSAPVTFTLDGAGTFANAAAAPATLQSLAASANATGQRAIRGALPRSIAMRSLVSSVLRGMRP